MADVLEIKWMYWFSELMPALTVRESIGLAFRQEGGKPQSVVQRQFFIRRPGVTGIGGRFQSQLPVQPVRLLDGRFSERIENTAVQPVAGQVEAVNQGMGIGLARKAGLGENFVDEGPEPVAVVPAAQVVQPVGIAVVTGADQQVRLFAGMAPAEGGVEIVIAESRIGAEREIILRCIGIQGEFVVVAQFMGQAEIDVGKIGGTAGIAAVFLRDPLQHPVGITLPHPENDRGTVLDQRALQMQAAGQQAQAQGAFELLHVAFLGGNFHDRGNASAVIRRDGTLVQFHTVDQRRIESGEDAEQVGRIPQSHVIEQDEVLVGGAAADIETGRGLPHGFDARQGQDGLDQVSFSEGAGNPVDGLHRNALHTHLGGTVVAHGLRGNDGAVELGNPLGHRHIQGAAAVDHDLQIDVLFRKFTEIQHIVTIRERYPETSLRIRRRIGLRIRVIDRHGLERRTFFQVRHPAGQYGFLATAQPVLADVVNLVPVLENHGRSIDRRGLRFRPLRIEITDR